MSYCTLDPIVSCDIYTDGACRGNPGPGGWGACIVSQEKIIHEFSGKEKYTTNNIMELTGAIEGLRLAHVSGYRAGIKIYTDSQYVKQGINVWIIKWTQNNWKTANKKDVKNKELWCELNILHDFLKPEWYWVKGHADNVWNNYADKLARDAIV